MAQNLADGLTPEIASRFHKQVLDLRAAGDLTAELYRRKDVVSSTVLPGLGPKVSTVRDGIYFVIGPEKQFAAWEEYLKSVESPDTIVYRLILRLLDVIRESEMGNLKSDDSCTRNREIQIGSLQSI